MRQAVLDVSPARVAEFLQAIRQRSDLEVLGTMVAPRGTCRFVLSGDALPEECEVGLRMVDVDLQFNQIEGSQVSGVRLAGPRPVLPLAEFSTAIGDPPTGPE